MKKLLLMAATAFLCLQLPAKTALVVMEHGSPSEYWNQQALALESRLQALEMPGIDYVRVALMEFAQYQDENKVTGHVKFNYASIGM